MRNFLESFRVVEIEMITFIKRRRVKQELTPEIKRHGTPICAAVAESKHKQLSISFLLSKKYHSYGRIKSLCEITFFF